MKKSRENAAISDISACKNINEYDLPKEDLSTDIKGSLYDEDQSKTPKAQLQTQSQSSPEVRRWASVVKAKKKLLMSSEIGTRSDSSDITPEIFDCVFKSFPKNFEAHKGFISCNQSLFYCNICHIELESVLSLSNHLKTRNHEDNIICFFKEKIPLNLHYLLEFVSFYDSNLCCNLCRCEIAMSSYNLYESIVNIMAHNTDANHTTHETHRGEENEAYLLIKTLAATVPEIKENLCLIEKKMSPCFKCQLCEKPIVFDEDLNVLRENFITHLKSAYHLRGLRAVEILKQFRDRNVNLQDNFIVINANISCIHCKQYVEANVQKLASHLNGVKHCTNVRGKVNLSPGVIIYSELKLHEENVRNEKYISAVAEEKISSHQTNEQKCKPKLSDVLKSFTDSNEINYLIENERGSVTCLLCKRIIAPSIQNIRTHILGSIHKKNEITWKPEEKDNSKYLKSVSKRVPIMCSLNENTNVKIQGKEFGNTNELNCFICRKYPLCEQIQNVSSTQRKSKINCFLACPERSLKDGGLQRKNNFTKSWKEKKEILLTSKQNEIFNQLLQKNVLVALNKSVFEINIDGIHIYCKLCRALIQFSVDPDVFESSVVRHLQGRVHVGNCVNQKDETSLLQLKSKSSVYKNIEASFSNLQKTKIDDCVIDTPKSNSSFVSSTSDINSSTTESEDNTTKDVNSLETLKKLYSAKLPVIDSTSKPLCLMAFREETDENTLKRRQKQIDYGKNTLGYSRYCQRIPKAERKPYYPETPPKHLKCSRRTWDGMVRVWRRQLHAWDPPSETSESLDLDIQPLTPVVCN